MRDANVQASAGWGNTDQLLQAIVVSATNVRRRPISCSIDRCPHCNHKPGQNSGFKLHAFRRRQFLVVVGRYVHKVHSLVPRWKCPDCNRTFTEYPPFAVSHKRYTLPQIANCAFLYLTDTRASYRKCVKLENQPIFHGGECVDSRESESALNYTTLAHATLFHWFSSLHAEEDATRKDFQPAPCKYMSEERRLVLIKSHRFLSSYLRKSPRRV